MGLWGLSRKEKETCASIVDYARYCTRCQALSIVDIGLVQFTLLKLIIKPINTLNYYKIGIMIGLIWSNLTDNLTD